MGALAIRTEGLTRDFGRLRAVDSLDLAIPPGTIFGFLGPNGAGKTTTVRLLLGLIAPQTGRAEVLGLDVSTQAHEIRERSGALLEHHGLYERLTAEENLLFHARVRRLAASERSQRVRRTLDRIGLLGREKEPVGGWSRGMKQRLAVARAVLHRPSLVFLDEPTAGLDPVVGASLHEEIRELALRDGTTVFLTTHNLSEAEKLCTMIGVIRSGRLLAVGSLQQLRDRREAPRLWIRGDGFTPAILDGLRAHPAVVSAVAGERGVTLELRAPSDTPALIAWLVGRGIAVEEARPQTASLEELFLTLVREEPAS